MLIKENTPIIDSEGNVVALLASDFEMDASDHFSWTWVSPSNHADLVRGPQFVDEAQTVPINRGTFRVAFHKGQVTVLACDLHGDTAGAFSGRWFRRPDDPVGETWRGKISAIRVLREYLDDPMTKPTLDRLEEMFTYYAEREEESE